MPNKNSGTERPYAPLLEPYIMVVRLSYGRVYLKRYPLTVSSQNTHFN